MSFNYNTCNLSASDVSILVTKQNPKIYLEVLAAVNTDSPWANIIPSSPTEANAGDTIESAVTPRAVTNQDQVEPDFSNSFFDACLLDATQAQPGNIRFSTQLSILRGETEPICLFSNYDTVFGALEQSISALKSEITYLYNSDVQAKLTRYSGVKASVIDGQKASNTIVGDEWQTSVAFPALPTAQITFAYVKALYNFFLQEFQVERFGSGADANAKLIASSQVIDAFRNEAGPNQTLVASTTGGYSDGKNALWEYLWIDSNFRGMKFAENRYPLRFNAVDGNGYPIFLPPRVKVAVTSTNSGNGYRLARNPLWSNATYEVAHLVFQNSFRRRVPQQFVSQGEIKFPSQNFGGMLQWVFRPDNSCNKFGDKGYFLYQMARAYQAVMPHAFVPIVFKRCPDDYGLQLCSGS